MNPLTELDNDGSAQPALAVNWSSQNDNQRWAFQLRAGVSFQDGTPLTADAVVASLQASCALPSAPETLTSSVLPLCPWSAVSSEGASEVVITTSSPEPDLPELLAQTEFSISEKDSSGTIEGTGPFKVAGFSNGALTLVANGDCWQGRPYLDTVEVFQHRSIRDQWLDLSVGQADVVQVPPELVPEAQQQHLNVMVSRPVDLLALLIPAQGQFANLNMRQAAALAVDRAALHDVIFQKQGKVTASLLPEWLSGYSFLFPTGRNLSGAQALRGGAPAAPVMLSVKGDSAILQLAAERLALNLNEAGFHVRTGALGPQGGLRLRQVSMDETQPRAALDEMLNVFGVSVTVNGSNPEALWEVEKTVLQNATVVPLLWLPRAWATGERVRDLRLSPEGEPLLTGVSLEGGK
jgi:peptide/nickel transport system substrate-binding protein